MQRKVIFPIKGTFYYAADEALKSGFLDLQSHLLLKPEPNNEYDPYAIQIWLVPEQDNPASATLNHGGYLMGYIPRVMSKQLSLTLNAQPTIHLHITHLARSGKQIEIDCELTLTLPFWPFLILKLLSLWSLTTTKGKRLTKTLI